MEDTVPDSQFAETTPPIAPLPPGSRRKRSPRVVDTSSASVEPIADQAQQEPERIPTFISERGAHFARLSEGSARALAAAESAYRIAQNLQSIVNAFNPDDVDDELRPYMANRINQLYATATQLNDLMNIITPIVLEEWQIYRTIFPTPSVQVRD